MPFSMAGGDKKPSPAGTRLSFPPRTSRLSSWASRERAHLSERFPELHASCPSWPGFWPPRCPLPFPPLIPTRAVLRLFSALALSRAHRPFSSRPSSSGRRRARRASHQPPPRGGRWPTSIKRHRPPRLGEVVLVEPRVTDICYFYHNSNTIQRIDIKFGSGNTADTNNTDLDS